jgi:hypothetical protein
MKNVPLTMNLRDRERGAVAIVIGVMWTALFGLAVMAVDFGYLYTKKRNLQTVADAVLKTAMPAFASNNGTLPTLAQYNANQIAHLSGYDDDGGATTKVEYIPTAGPPARLEVKISRKHPTFFAGIFGMQPRMISASAQGEVNSGGGGAAIQALALAPCLAPVWGAGFFAQGNTTLTVNGSIESNSQVFLQPSSGSITGSVKTDCNVPLSVAFNPNSVTVAGGQTQIVMGAITDSISASVASVEPFCTGGTSMYTAVGSALLAAPATWTNTGGLGGCDTPANQVYCSAVNMNVAPTGSLSICPGSRATFLSQGQIMFGAGTAIALQPATGAPNNLVAASFGSLGAASCSGGFDVFMGTAGTYALQGNVYAPNGCAAFGGGGSGFLMTGQIVGKNIDIQMSPGPGFTVTAPGGGPSGTWKTVR